MMTKGSIKQDGKERAVSQRAETIRLDKDVNDLLGLFNSHRSKFPTVAEAAKATVVVDVGTDASGLRVGESGQVDEVLFDF
jgi:hypothetical protein